ncbi:hypothetical protein HanIR_Chr16g0788951 [Helianthus annuus]|nr:hypothetical protein HanIR_Chr16g0788951 [Helianthus annuus]
MLTLYYACVKIICIMSPVANDVIECGDCRLYRVIDISSRSVRGQRSSQVMDCTWVCMWSLNLIYVC